jgi:hypothetical protein
MVRDSTTPLTIVVKPIVAAIQTAKATWCLYFRCNHGRDGLRQAKYHLVQSSAQVPIHVCLSALMVQQIALRFGTTRSSFTAPRPQVTLCLATQSTWLFAAAVKLAGNVPLMIETAVRIAQLVNSVEKSTIRSDRVRLELVIPRVRRHRDVAYFGVLLQQLSDNHQVINTRWSDAKAGTKEARQLRGLLEQVTQTE